MNWQRYLDLDNRRRFLQRTGMGLGATALAALNTPAWSSPAQAGTHGAVRFPAKAKRVIFLFMAGAPSQLDLFDEKPELHKQFNQPLPPSVSNGQRVTAMTKGKEQRVAPSIRSILSNTDGPFAEIFQQFQTFRTPSSEGGDR